MDQLDLINIFHRELFVKTIKEHIYTFEKEQRFKGIYIYGNTGIGKTYLVKQILKCMNYDILDYNINNSHNMSILSYFNTNYHTNVLSMLNNKIQKIAIVVDEMDCLLNTDKIIINSLIKILMTPKKQNPLSKSKEKHKITKILTPIIFIGNSNTNKKIKELMKECITYVLPSPTKLEMSHLISLLFNNLQSNEQQIILNYVETDLRKVHNIYPLVSNSFCPSMLFGNEYLLKKKTFIEDTKNVTKHLINHNMTHISEHGQFINESDRTSVGLLWHENVIDVLEQLPKKQSISIYANILNTISFADYIDRITFQKQVWQFNEMSAILKIFKNNYLLHQIPFFEPLNEMRFTKVLTKYSTEYSNSIFLQKMCQKTGLDKKDLYYFFIFHKYNKQKITELYDINKLELNRLYRLLEQFTLNINHIKNKTDLNLNLNDLNNKQDDEQDDEIVDMDDIEKGEF